MLMEPMQGKLASSQFDLRCTELYCVPEVTSVFFSSCDCVLGESLEFNQASRLLTSLIGKMELLCMQCRRISPHLAVRGKSHGFSRVAAGTWGIRLSYGGYVHSKLEFVQRSQDTCLGTWTPQECKLGLAGHYRCL